MQKENKDNRRYPVYFVGAGPGDPDLITKKGDKLLQNADLIVYTGSLINTELLNVKKDSCKTYDSANMTKDEVVELITEYVFDGKMVVRLHTGDPSLYGAIQEQQDALYEKDIETKVIPGISAFQGSAASLGRQLTLPDITQTVILTRVKGKTSHSNEEDLKDLAAHNATLCLYLSIQDVGKVVEELKEGGMTDATPTAVIYKATWPEEKIIKGTLSNIEEKVKEAKIEKTALIMVGEVLDADKNAYKDSKLYHPDFEHGYRNKTNN
ncbi:precorrin-4 C(11)-methyltransferase [Natranaerofaba carboxydovora]|uniref:precorrin-4 C(11)-methyltransferase n=1 Tax=Natranaerofaba carboxydovora TaxID=2742683 RepID=UPI001F14621E|nr:precorrin-4 C(11)-methyltransferase [Natranaerofaba carboxydovora]UMZ73137.1 Cobalt-precorrin-4 C(11)-methyltransferase [Natranaerofaba carboxydovora]